MIYSRSRLGRDSRPALRELPAALALAVEIVDGRPEHVGHGGRSRAPARLAYPATLDRPIVRLERHGFEIGRSLHGDLLYVADRAAEQAREVPPDPTIIGVARILDALELVLRRRRDGTTSDDDSRSLRALERLAKKHLETRRWVSRHAVSSRKDERWQGIGWQLPARDDFDRAERVRDIGARAERLARSGNALLNEQLSEPEKRRDSVKGLAYAVAIELISEVWRSKTVDTQGRDKEADTETLKKDFERRFKATKLTGQLLTKRALVACGLSRDTAKNWTRTGHLLKG